MLNRRMVLKSTAVLAVMGSLVLGGPARAADEGAMKVVATFSILGDMVSRIGGDHIALTTLVGPNGDAHVYQPVPADAVAVKEAKVLFVNGLAFEGWLDRLIDASGFSGTRVIATRGVDALSFEEEDDHDDHDDHADHKDDDHAGHKDDDHAGHKDDDHHDHADHKDDDHADHKDDDHAGHDNHDDHAGHDHGAFDPHAWQSLHNAVIYVDNITAALSKADPANASTYYQNRAAYVAELETMEAEIHTMFDALPEDARTVVTPHDAFGYFAEEHDMTFLAPQGISTESEASAADVAELIRQIREAKVKAVFLENITDTRLLEQIASETGVGIGGELFSDALSEPDGPAGTYIDMMRHNAKTLSSALGS